MTRATFGGGGAAPAVPAFDPVAEAAKHRIPTEPSGRTAQQALSEYAARPGARIVFLTGATGHVGAYILHALAHSAAVGAVVCLVRAKDPASGLGRLRDAWAKRKLLRAERADGALFDAKVSCVCGEVSKPLLGLSEAAFHGLGRRTDFIIHVAAEVNMVKPPQALAASNVGGTATVLHLAALAGAPVAFTSTMLPLGDTAPSGYRQTKAAAEAVCERHFESHGVPSAPLQLGDIGMATAAGSVIPDDDAFVIVLKACVALGLFPDVPWASSLMAVDQCASLFVRLLVDAPAGEFSGRPSEVKGSLVPWGTLYEWLRLEVPALRKVPLHEWREAASARRGSLFQQLGLVFDDFADEQGLEGERFARGGGDGVEVTRQGVSLTVGEAWGRQLAATIRDELAESARAEAALAQAAVDEAADVTDAEGEGGGGPAAVLASISQNLHSRLPRVPSKGSIRLASKMRQAGKTLRTLAVNATGGRLPRNLSFVQRESVKHKLRSAPANVRKVFKRAVGQWRERRERRARGRFLVRAALGTATSAMLVRNLGYAPLVVSRLGLRRPGAFDGSDESVVLLWWAALLVNSLLQLKWFFTVKENLPTLNGAQRKRFLCAAAYLIGSTVRALYPVNWEVRPHACMFNTSYIGSVLGGELVDRVLATGMELAIAHLVVSAIADVSELHARTSAARLARACFYLVGVAQVACWLGVVTDNKLYHVYEEGLWGIAFTVLLGITVHTRRVIAVRDHPGEIGQARLLTAICPLISLYLAFLFTHDIPMYLRQWAADQAAGTKYNDLQSGMQALLQCDAVERSFAMWQEGLPWMTATFVPGPYIAILLLEASVRSEVAIHHGASPWPLLGWRAARPARRPSAEEDVVAAASSAS